MCGIAGILVSPPDAAPDRLGAVGAMAAALRHRGPDAEGFWLDPSAGVALGHRRLSIVDLSDAGSQPMVSNGGDLVLAYNGEIYNFRDLRTELEARGCRFRGHGDTEVMLAAFETWGLVPALRRFAGMFAFALWDRRNHVLHLGRDRMGKKPLHVALVNGALVFGSELKALRVFPGFAPEIDEAALALVLRHGWVPDQCCIWKEVLKLPPGTVLSVSPAKLGGLDIDALMRAVQPWWSLSDVAENGQVAPFRAGDAELEEELDQLLRRTVGERLVADVPVGAFLSGGIDSSAVVALMQAQSSQPVRTFTVGFAEPGYDEADEAAAIARHLGTQHSQFQLTPADVAAVVPDLPRIWDEPFAAESQIATFLMSRLARESVTVALSGDGGDECFGGYARHFASRRLQWALRTPAALRRPLAIGLRRVRPETLGRVLRRLPGSGAAGVRLATESLEKIGRILSATDEADLYQHLTSLGGAAAGRTPCSNPASRVPPLPDLASRFIYRDMDFYLRGNVLVKLDRATMACGLEGRSPLLDHRVVEFSWRLPPSAKVRAGQGKWLLRRVLRRYVPAGLFDRPKSGFNVPVGRWVRGPLREWASDLLAEPRLRRQGMLNVPVVQDLWQQHQLGQSDHGCELWAILMVQGWLDAHRAPLREQADATIPLAPQSERVRPAGVLTLATEYERTSKWHRTVTSVA